MNQVREVVPEMIPEAVRIWHLRNLKVTRFHKKTLEIRNEFQVSQAKNNNLGLNVVRDWGGLRGSANVSLSDIKKQTVKKTCVTGFPFLEMEGGRDRGREGRSPARVSTRVSAQDTSNKL